MNLKKMMKKATAVLLSAGMLVSTGIVASAEGIDWNHSKSKTATNLDANFESNVTLSLPSAEEQLVTDVVFVLDKSTSANVENQITTMLGNLKDQTKSSGAKINVGIVIFNKVANRVLELTELNDDNWDMIQSAIQQEISSGTNLHAGLMAGKGMLDADNSVKAERKYLITVSDGITYLYNEEPTVTGIYWLNDGSPYLASDTESWHLEYGSDAAPADWAGWINEVGTRIAANGQQDIPYATAQSYGNPSKLTADELNGYGYQEVQKGNLEGRYGNIDKALYLSYQNTRKLRKRI